MDVQERLVYRTYIYIKNDIFMYKAASGDLAYPEKLEMMEVSCSIFLVDFGRIAKKVKYWTIIISYLLQPVLKIQKGWVENNFL